ncbi:MULTISPECIES: PRC-barrel domain-containing protein [Sphingosinicellaceae]|uniref:PRC-barrel domain-containing protein n=1 Tax=Sphingosinicellaceae TaxID=2820280 RepID=UPI001C1E4340|nr:MULTISPECIES: PRC-barrel domain-containing protein [Polymorphobacter]QYE33495.1 PRC-barrel domain-containing protein [Polymorphobacter sp. PAMC 29334]UAJ12858.1 PRC-barrel domain-containing protein [Polymorphobacter megasporae]
MTAAGVLIAVEVASAAFPQKPPLVVVDPKTLAQGYRITRVVGSEVIDDAGETVGRVDDLIVTLSGKVPYVVLAVGIFPRVAPRLVVLPATALDRSPKGLVLHGATRAALGKLPRFTYEY